MQIACITEYVGDIEVHRFPGEKEFEKTVIIGHDVFFFPDSWKPGSKWDSTRPQKRILHRGSMGLIFRQLCCAKWGLLTGLWA